MKKITVYAPVVKDGGDGTWFTVNGATCENEAEAISKARRHVAFRNKETKIVRIDTEEVWDEDFYRKL